MHQRPGITSYTLEAFKRFKWMKGGEVYGLFGCSRATMTQSTRLCCAMYTFYCLLRPKDLTRDGLQAVVFPPHHFGIIGIPSNCQVMSDGSMATNGYGF